MTRAITRDSDLLMTQDGPFAIARAASTGLPTKYSDSALNLGLTYDTMTRLTERNATVAGAQAYDVKLTRDAAGRVIGRTETIGGTAHTYAYTYTADNFLSTVKRDTVLVEQYAYDANGNRTSRLLPAGGTETSTYDQQDKLTQRGATAYQFDVDGYLKARGANSFKYTAQGELVEATVGATTVRYQYDAAGRRIGRTVGASRYAYFYGDPRRPYQVTAVRDPGGVLTSFYYDQEGVLYALTRGATRYYVGSDQVGTPHVVANAAGTVVKSLAYDSFGNTLSDSNAAFDLPIGFAGGLSDSVTQLVRYGRRDFDPAAGRWTARDPLFFSAPAVNLYAYVDNNPISMRDTNGMDWSWQGFKTAVSEYGHSAVEAVSKLIHNDHVELAKDTFDKGQKVIDTANEIGDTYIEAKEALAEKDDAHQAKGLFKCGLKWIHKIIPIDYITPQAEHLIDEGATHMDRQAETGTIHMGGEGRITMDQVFAGERN